MKNKIVVITGSSKGLGKSLAYSFAKRGAKVVVCSRDEDENKKIAEEIGGLAVTVDITKEEDIHRLVSETISNFGKIDFWINNAGVWLPHSLVEELDIERVKAIFEINVYGLMYASKASLIQMRKQGNGTIVNIVSTSGLAGRALSSGYSASKFAVRGFTESLQEATKDSQIKVVAVYPGGMKTGLFDEKKPDDYNEYMDVDIVAEKIVTNLEKENPEIQQIIKRGV